MALRDAVVAVLDRIEPSTPAPVDLSPVLDGLRALHLPAAPAPLDIDRLAVAIAQALPRNDGVGDVLAQVSEQLRRLNKKVTSMSVMPSGGASGHVIVDSGNLALSQAVDILDRAGRELGLITVANPTANPETGLAKDATVGAVRDRLPAALAANGGLNVNLVNAPPESEEFTVLASGTRTASFDGAALTNPRHRGLRLYLDVTARSGTLSPTLDVKIQSQDAVSGGWVDMGAAFAQVTAVGLYALVVYPGINQAAGRVSNVMDRRWRLVHTIAGTGPSFTYSVGGTYLP